MGVYAIRMPDIGEGIAEVEVVAWRVAPGDAVKEDQTVADVMTASVPSVPAMNEATSNPFSGNRCSRL